FQQTPAHYWDDYAWQRPWQGNKSFTDKPDASLGVAQSSRLDYLVLQGLQDKGAPAGVTGFLLTWRDQLIGALKEALQDAWPLRPQDFIAMLQGLGVGAGDVLDSVWEMAGHDLGVTATALRAAGTSFGDIVTQLWDKAGQSLSSMATALNAAGADLAVIAPLLWDKAGHDLGQLAAALWSAKSDRLDVFNAIAFGAGQGLVAGVQGLVGSKLLANSSYEVAKFLLNESQRGLGDVAQTVSDWLG